VRDTRPTVPDAGPAVPDAGTAVLDAGTAVLGPGMAVADAQPAGYGAGPAGPTGGYDIGPATYDLGFAGARESGYVPAPTPAPAPVSAEPASEEPASWPAELYRPPPPVHPLLRRPGRKLILAVAAATIVVVLAIVGIALLQGPGHPAGPLPAVSSAPPAAPATASHQASAVHTLLGSSAVTRKDLISAVAQVRSCARVSAAVSQIQQVVNQRSAEYSRASAMSTAALADGATVKSDLLAALRNSLQADRDYLTWARQQLARCRPNAPSPAYNAAISADQQADVAKGTFVRVWNPVAAKYGLPAETTSSF
jgi:hypothetical protein